MFNHRLGKRRVLGDLSMSDITTVHGLMLGDDTRTIDEYPVQHAKATDGSVRRSRITDSIASSAELVVAWTEMRR